MKDVTVHSGVERFDSGERIPEDTIEIGQWYWTTTTNYKGEEDTWLGCVMAVGSNYVELHSPPDARGGNYSSTRVHFDEIEAVLRYEPNAEAYIQSKIAHYQGRVNTLLGEVKDVTARLGVVPTERIADKSGEQGNTLMIMSEQVDASRYKNALIEAKDKTLPDLFEEIEKASQSLARWMVAPTLPMKAKIGPMKSSIKGVEDRIYTLELYAGLTEDAQQIREGDPAGTYEKLRVMQRRLYMDEECLANYEAGGMEFKDIGKFDEWLARSENFERLLPFARCLVAFRVRRGEKDRSADSLYQAFINMELRELDKVTILYIRNGDQLWRVNCDFDFGPKLIPDQAEFDPTQPMMVKMFTNRVDEIIPLSAWEVMRDKELEKKRLKDEWDATHPEEEHIQNPYGWMGFHMDYKDYKPFDPSNVYYDEAVDHISRQIKDYNRVAVILQGLFDRSMVLHPHAPVKMWDPASFADSVEPIYDATTLTHGDKPDFEAYRKRLNDQITPESIVTGQEDYWMRQEAAKENRRQKDDWRIKNPSNYERLSPYGNPGPGFIGPMADWKPRVKRATFRWTRERLRYDPYARGGVTAAVSVPADALLNVSAYKPGDFKIFFNDSRTRQEYLKWAPLLLAAEDYHAGKESPFVGYNGRLY